MLVPPESSSYYQILVNPNGNYSIIHVGIDAKKLIPAKEFKISSNASIALEANSWNVNLGIPLDQFGADLNGTWKFNIFRNRRIDRTTGYQASGIYLKEYHFHKLEQYPTLKLR